HRKTKGPEEFSSGPAVISGVWGRAAHAPRSYELRAGPSAASDRHAAARDDLVNGRATGVVSSPIGRGLRVGQDAGIEVDIALLAQLLVVGVAVVVAGPGVVRVHDRGALGDERLEPKVLFGGCRRIRQCLLRVGVRAQDSPRAEARVVFALVD